jgi:uncharacterized linocin/CFP29 family protein
MAVDFIMNGVAYGDVATRLLNSGMDHRVLRPYLHTDGNSYVTINQDGKPVAVRLAQNSATLPYDVYKYFDNVIETAARPRMRAFGDLRARGNVLNIPNAMGKTMIQSQTRGRITPATLSMDGIRRSERDRMQFDVNLTPIPIVHKDFSFTLRDISESRNGGPALDTMMVEDASERCAEEIEKLTLGVSASYTFGGGTIYGYGNHPARMTKTLTLPTAGGWTPKTLLTEIMAMRQQAYDKGYIGPFILYVSPNWDTYLDADYSDVKGDITLRDRILKLSGIDDIVTLDYLSGYRVMMVQRTSNVARAIVGMDLQTLQWETHGGMLINFKVMGILLPQVRADNYGVAGIVDGVAA